MEALIEPRPPQTPPSRLIGSFRPELGPRPSSIGPPTPWRLIATLLSRVFVGAINTKT